MNIFEKFFHVEILHFIIALGIVFLIDAMLKSKYKLLPEDKYLERIRRDKSSFINYIALVILCAGLSVVFSKETMNVFEWTLNFLAILSLGQYVSLSKFSKDAGNTHYNKVKELVDFMLMGCWGARIIIAYKSDYEFWVTVGVMAFFTVASLWGLKELKKIESDYLSTM